MNRQAERWAATETSLDVIEHLWRIMWRSLGAMAVTIAIVLGLCAGAKIAKMTGLHTPKVQVAK
jgi:hypothetical protein